MSSPPRASLLAVGLLPVVWGLPPSLVAGGLAPVAAALVVAGFVGAPLANLAWEPPEGPRDPARRTAGEALAELGLASWAATGTAVVVARGAPDAGGPAPALVLAALALAAGAFLGRTRAAPALPALALGTAGVGALAAAPWETPPWTLLEPHFETWRGWAGPAALLGVGLAGVGSGLHGAVVREPGGRRLPWGAVGAGLGFALLLAAREGCRFTAGAVAPGGPAPDLLRFGAELAALAAAAPVVFRRPAWVLGASLWLVLAGAAATAATVLVPALAVAALALRAAAARGPARVGLLLAGVGITVAAAGAPAWPAEVGPAAAVGALVVAAFWWAATRVALAARGAA